MDSVGAVLSTAKVALGSVGVAVFPAVSDAVPPAKLMPKVSSPLMALIVTVGVLVVPPLTDTVPVAVPVVSKDTSPVVRFTVSAPL